MFMSFRILCDGGSLVGAPRLCRRQGFVDRRGQSSRIVKWKRRRATRSGPSCCNRGPTRRCLKGVGVFYVEEILATKRKMVLEKDEYIQLLDKKTGNERVLIGPLKSFEIIYRVLRKEKTLRTRPGGP